MPWIVQPRRDWNIPSWISRNYFPPTLDIAVGVTSPNDYCAGTGTSPLPCKSLPEGSSLTHTSGGAISSTLSATFAHQGQALPAPPHLCGGVYTLVRASRSRPRHLPGVAEVVLAHSARQVKRQFQLSLHSLSSLISKAPEKRK